MGQGVWLDSETLGPEDEVGQVLRHGTLTIGFIGLAETLVALIGQHHGQSEYAQNLGLEIIGHMRARDGCCQRTDEAQLFADCHPGRRTVRQICQNRPPALRRHPGHHRPRLLHQLLPHSGLLRHQRLREDSPGSPPTTR